jgi:hypothetical protein
MFWDATQIYSPAPRAPFPIRFFCHCFIVINLVGQYAIIIIELSF